MPSTPALARNLSASLASAAFDERRAHQRFPCGWVIRCTDPVGVRWPAFLYDVSVVAAAVVVADRCPAAGTPLILELQCRAGRFGLPVPSQVLHSRPYSEGDWLVVCTFDTPLADEEMDSLLV